MRVGTNYIIGVMLGFLAILSSLYGVLLPNSYLRLMPIGCILVLVGMKLLQNSPGRIIASYVILSFFMLGYLLVNSGWELFDTLLYATMVLLCISSEKDIQWTGTMFQVVQVGYVIYAIATIYLYFNRSVYMNYVVPLFPKTAYRLIGWYNNGYMAGLTNHYSTNAMLLAVGIIIFGAKILAIGKDTGYAQMKKRKSFIVLFLVILVALLLTAKRAHILFAVSALFCVYAMANWNQSASKKMIRIVGTALAVLVLGNVVLSLFPALSGFIVRFQDTMDKGDVSRGRYQIWAYAITAFKDHWVTGIGWKNFATKISIAYNGVKVYDVHNIYLQLLAETGVIGASVYFFWFVSILKSTLRSYKQFIIEGSYNDRFLLSFSLGFQVFFLLYGLTGNPLYDNEMYIPYFVSCSIALFYGYSAKRSRLGGDNTNEQSERLT